jgi:hypothetical protein
MKTRVLMILIFALAPLMGCVHRDMRDGVRAMKGEDFKYITSLLGPPSDLVDHRDGERTVAWSNVENLTLTVPETTSSYGTVAGHDFSIYTTYSTTEHYQYDCTITARVNKEGKITKSTYQGDIGGCSKYRNRLSGLIGSYRVNHIDNIGPDPSEVPLVECEYEENGKIKDIKTSDRGCDDLNGKIIEIIEEAG